MSSPIFTSSGPTPMPAWVPAGVDSPPWGQSEQIVQSSEDVDDQPHRHSCRLCNGPRRGSQVLDRTGGLHAQIRATHDRGDSMARGRPKAAETALVLYPKAIMEDWQQRKPS